MVYLYIRFKTNSYSLVAPYKNASESSLFDSVWSTDAENNPAFHDFFKVSNRHTSTVIAANLNLRIDHIVLLNPDFYRHINFVISQLLSGSISTYTSKNMFTYFSDLYLYIQ